MESLKSYLRVPGLRLPSLASLRDGSFLTKALEKVDREAKKEQSFLKDFEVEDVTIKNICDTKIIFAQSQLVRVQEAAVWSSPLVSCVWVVVTQVEGLELSAGLREISQCPEKALEQCMASTLRRKIEVFPHTALICFKNSVTMLHVS